MMMIRLSFLLIFVFSLVNAKHPAVHRRSRARAFVELQCRVTCYPELCVSYFSDLITNSNATQLSHQQLALIALRVSLAIAQSTRVYVTQVGKQFKKSKAKDYQQVKDCLDQINDIKELQQMNEDGESEFPIRASNVQTWMSAAVTYVSSYLDGFSSRSIGGKTKAMIKAKVLNLVQVNINALALFNRFAARYI